MATNSASRLASLRELAQSHLSEIESEKQQEERQSSQTEAEIQRYAKLPAFDRKKQHTTLIEHSSVLQEVTKPRFRPFQDILHRLRWDPKLNINDYVVGYLERFEGIKEMSAMSWIRDFSDEDWIPMHRVRYVKRIHHAEDDEGPELGIVWSRDERVDKFASNDDQEDLRSMDGTSVSGGLPLR